MDSLICYSTSKSSLLFAMPYPKEFVFNPFQTRLSHLAEHNLEEIEMAPFLLFSPSFNDKNFKIRGIETYSLDEKGSLIFCSDSRGGLSIQKLSKDNGNFFLNSFNTFLQKKENTIFQNIDTMNNEKLIMRSKKRKYFKIRKENDSELDDVSDGEFEKIEKKMKTFDLSRLFKKKILKKNKFDEKYFNIDSVRSFENTMESTQEEKIRFLKSEPVCLEDLIFAQTNEDLKTHKGTEMNILDYSNRDFKIDEEVLKRLKNSWDC